VTRTDIAETRFFFNIWLSDFLGSWIDEFLTKEFLNDILGEVKDRGQLGLFGDTNLGDWIFLVVTMTVLALFDYFVLSRYLTGSINAHLTTLVLWFFVGIGYDIVIWHQKGQSAAVEWCSGYLLEVLLSMDNIFLFHVIFKLYDTPEKLKHKALSIGILGAFLARFLCYMAITSLLQAVYVLRFFFGVFLMYSGVKAIEEEENADDDEPVENGAVTLLKSAMGSRLLPYYDTDTQSILLRVDRKICATLLVPVILSLELTDIIFAIDSISAKAAAIPDLYLGYSSSLLAMFGLRAAFFVIEDLLKMFDLLKYGLCFILVFIGAELCLSFWVKLPAHVVLTVIGTVFLVCIVGSVTRKSKTFTALRPSIPEATSYQKDLLEAGF